MPGATGAQGPTGAVGPTGVAGPTGAPGATGTGLNVTDTDVAAGATANLTQKAIQVLNVDTTGAAVTLQLPSAPNDGDLVIWKAIGATFGSAITVTARGGATVELYSAQGTFSAGNGSTTTPQNPGMSSWLQYVAAHTRWETLV